MKRILFLFLLSSASLFAQVEGNRLSAEQFVHWVDKYHPVLMAVRNKLPIAKAELLKARGQFDPAIIGNLSSKNAGDILYYSLPIVGLSIPTATPVDVQVNWSRADGTYVNPQNVMPDLGMFTVGGMVKLGNGLMTDERRTSLAIAKAGVDLTEAEAQLYRNKLLSEAAKDYWKWYEAYASLKAYESAVFAAKEVYDFTINSFNAGDAAAIDTLDARALLNTWTTDYYKARNKAIATLYQASNWLWNENQEAILLKAETTPMSTLPHIQVELQLNEEHPLYVYNDNKEEQFRLKRQLAREYLKPKVAVGGSFILPGDFTALPTTEDFSTNNRFLQANINMPLFMRTGRGYSKSQNLQLENFRLERKEIENSWNNAMSAAAEGILQLEVALIASIKNQESLKLLLEAEQKKLELGDSELIKVNLRTGYYAKALIETADINSQLGAQKALWQQLSATF